MRIVVAGGTGFLGRALVADLRAHGHEVLILTRKGDGQDGTVPWTPDGTSGPWTTVADGVDAIVNLAGAALDRGRWTEARKRALVDSRVLPTRSLARAIAGSTRPPRVFLSASGVGYYGGRGDEVITEKDGPGSDFLARLVARWENEALAAASPRTRVVLLRSGLVLASDGGALGRMLLPFRLAAGGPFGRGRQFMAWIHRQDWVDLARWLLADVAVSGAVNATTPAPVTNEEFATTLARVLKRPHLLRAPATALRLVFGEMADAALLTGQRVVPAKAEAMGFTFRWPALEEALRDLLGRAASRSR